MYVKGGRALQEFVNVKQMESAQSLTLTSISIVPHSHQHLAYIRVGVPNGLYKSPVAMIAHG